MILELLVMNGYGQFVWPAFLLTVLSLSYLYVKTKSALKKQEEIFLVEFNHLNNKKIELVERKITTKEALTVN